MDTIFWMSLSIESCNWIDFISVTYATEKGLEWLLFPYWHHFFSKFEPWCGSIVDTTLDSGSGDPWFKSEWETTYYEAWSCTGDRAFLTKFLLSSHMHQENHEGTQVGSLKFEHGIWYISDTTWNQTHNLFRPKCAPISLGHSDGITRGFIQSG